MTDDLLESLYDTDPLVRNRAALLLGRLGSSATGAVPALIETLDDLNWRVRGRAAIALARIEPTNARIANRLLAMLADEVECARIEAYEAIAFMIDRNCFFDHASLATLSCFLSDDRADVRVLSVRILYHLGPAAAAAISPLVRALDDSDEDVQYWALESLGSMGLLASPCAAEVAHMLVNGSYNVKNAAISTLGQIGRDSASAISALKAFLHASNDQHLRFSAAIALTRIEEPPPSSEVASVLQEVMAFGNNDERRLAALALER